MFYRPVGVDVRDTVIGAEGLELAYRARQIGTCQKSEVAEMSTATRYTLRRNIVNIMEI